MMPENSPQLPQVDPAKFMEMGPWAKQAFDQSKDKVEISAGDGDQAIISVAMESFANDVAYSGVLAAYERSQKSSWLRGDGPLATKFDLLIHHFDVTKELLTNTEARREVQALIVNLCGGKERYKFLYEAEAENYQVADAVKTVVEQWVTTQSKQAQIDNLGRQPEKPAELVEPQEPLADAEEVYNGLNEKGRQAIDVFAAKFLEPGANPELVQDLIVLLPDLKTAADYIPGGSKALIEKMDLPNDLKKELGVLLNLKPIPKGKITIEKRVEQAIANNQLYSQIDQVINWRTGVLKERREAEQSLKQQAESLSFRLGEGKEGSVIEVPLELQQLVQEAARLGIDLPAKVLLADAAGVGSDQVGQISLTLDKGWGASRSSFEYKPFAKRTGDGLAAVEAVYTVSGKKLGNDYSLAKDEAGKIRLLKGDEKVADVSAQEGGQIVFNFTKGMAVDQSLTAMAALGQELNDFLGKDEKFPSLYLELKAPAAPETSAESEPAGTVPAGEKTELPTEETSGSDLEVPEPALIETSSQAPEMPDWLKALQAVPSIPAEPTVEETQAPFVPEAPKPVLVEKSRDPIGKVAQVIKERGTADFEFDHDSAHNLFYETLRSVIKDLYLPGLTINSLGINQFLISGGQIRLSVSAGGSFKKGILPAVGVSASIKFDLTSHLDLLGDPEIDLPRLAPKEARGLISDQLKQIKVELSRTIIRGLSANKISNANVENLGVANSSLVAKIRGKVSR